MKICYFGRLADAAGVRSEEVSGAATVGALRASLAVRVAGLGDPARVRALVDDVMVGEDYRLEEGAEIGFLPPVSGG